MHIVEIRQGFRWRRLDVCVLGKVASSLKADISVDAWRSTRVARWYDQCATERLQTYLHVGYDGTVFGDASFLGSSPMTTSQVSITSKTIRRLFAVTLRVLHACLGYLVIGCMLCFSIVTQVRLASYKSLHGDVYVMCVYHFSLAVHNRQSRFGQTCTNWPICVDVPLNNNSQSVSQSVNQSINQPVTFKWLIGFICDLS